MQSHLGGNLFLKKQNIPYPSTSPPAIRYNLSLPGTKYNPVIPRTPSNPITIIYAMPGFPLLSGLTTHSIYPPTSPSTTPSFSPLSFPRRRESISKNSTSPILYNTTLRSNPSQPDFRYNPVISSFVIPAQPGIHFQKQYIPYPL